MAAKEEKIETKSAAKVHSIVKRNTVINGNKLYKMTELSPLATPYTSLEAGNPGVSKIGLLTSNEKKKMVYYDIPTEQPASNSNGIRTHNHLVHKRTLNH